jgi:hypothetical protein
MNLFKRSTFWWTCLGVGAAGTVLGCLDKVPTEQQSQSQPPSNVSTKVRKVVLSTDTLRLAPVGAEGTLTARVYNSRGTELTGVSLKWWQSASSPFTRDVTVCRSPCTARFKGTAVGTARVIAYEYGGTARDTAWVTVSQTGTESTPPPSGSVNLVAAGDIAHCSTTGDEATAKLIDALPSATVAALGDNAYRDGTATEYANCYTPTWGRHKARTRPAPGNHDYHTSGASAYYAYFGANAGPSGRGYYSYDLGSWHIISLNSNVSMAVGSAQERWLRADLAASTRKCTLAYWHHPRFSSGTVHGNFNAAQPIWQALYDGGAEIALAGHEHNYERFGPQSPTGAADPARGLRQFVVGTGGAGHYNDLGTRKPNSQVFNGVTWGVIKLTLAASSYTWQFIPIAGQSFTDSGTGQCH